MMCHLVGRFLVQDPGESFPAAGSWPRTPLRQEAVGYAASARLQKASSSPRELPTLKCKTGHSMNLQSALSTVRIRCGQDETRELAQDGRDEGRQGFHSGDALHPFPT